MIIELAQGVSAVMTVCKKKTQSGDCTGESKYTQHLHCTSENHQVDSALNITGLVSEKHKHGLEWNEKVWSGLM